ncbi:glycosyltransferase family A protein [Algibacter sp. 2305UL17-15]|uniref:glycosyltransferase family 2 protein n=1 Tax=Algibacter sp. 2305UL17-15 TaxID=3231268 RepID=UPI003459D77F
MAYKISFCTVCMNRLDHLKQTLPQNIEDNKKYGNVEFVVLNYNSQDEIDQWMFSTMSEYLESGILKYYKTTAPKCFLMSHSKNAVTKLATGDIVCNVDADNFIGRGFAAYINKAYQRNQNIYIAVEKGKTQKDCYGRICMLKSDFITLKGYDENMTGYGFEDFDLRNRLELLGREVHYLSHSKFLKALTHDDNTRLKSESNANQIEKIYLRHINHAVTELLYLYRDGGFYKGKIITNRLYNSESIENLFIQNRTFDYEYRLDEDVWETGRWQEENGAITLVREGKSNGKIQNSPNVSDLGFYQMIEDSQIKSLIMFFSQINNRIRMKKNQLEKKIVVNETSFGETILGEI